jgi:drug/metabolite transporter (DMT)-like permease
MRSPESSARAEGEGGRAYLFMLLGSLAFASMGAFSHSAGERCDWHLVAVARSSLAFLFTLALSLASGVRLALIRPAVLWMRSVAGSLGVLFAFYALTHLPVSTALTLSNTVPVWVTLLAWPVLGQRPRAAVWGAVVTGLAGIVLIQRPEAGGDRLAAGLALANAFSTSVSMLGLNRLSGVDARAVVTHFSGVATVFTVAFMLLSGGRVDYAPLRPARRPRHRARRRALRLAHAPLAAQETVGGSSHDGLEGRRHAPKGRSPPFRGAEFVEVQVCALRSSAGE